MRTNPQHRRSGTRLRRSEAGILLVEALVYLSVFMGIMVMAGAAFYRTLDQTRTLRRVADDISRVLTAGERWRADVRAATRVPVLVTDGMAQALHLPQTNSEVIYLFDGAQVLRSTDTNGPWSPALTSIKASSFHHDLHTHVASWRWEIELKTTRANTRTIPLFSFDVVAAAEAKP